MAQQAHLYRINKTYYFRTRIPVDLQRWFNRSDLKRTLRTKSLTSARRLVKLWAFKTEQLFTTIRMSMLTDSQIQRLVEEYLQDTLRTSDEYRIEQGHQLVELHGHYIPAPPYEEFIERTLREVYGLDDFENRVRPFSGGYVVSIVDSFLETKGVQVDKDSHEYKRLCREIALAHVKALQIDRERDLGNFNDPYHTSTILEPLSVSTAAPAEAEPVQTSPLLTEVIEKYIEDYKRSDKCKLNSIEEYVSACETLPFIIGNKQVHTVSRDDIRDYLDGLKKLPTHRNKRPAYRGKSFKQLCQMEHQQLISPTTIKKYLDRVKGLFKWAEQEDWIVKSPAEGITYRKPKGNESDERSVLSREDLQRLCDGLGSEHIAGKLTGHPERVWIPLIGLYSGMRLNEICQLHIEDIQRDEESGIWHFIVKAEEDSDKELKTNAAQRLVPVHPKLIELGFIDYHQNLKANGQPRLWMNLSKTSKGYARKFSNWYLGTKGTTSFFRDKVTTDPKKNFHSMRHNFTDALKQLLVDERIIDETIGHKHESLSHNRYGKPYALKTMLDAISKIDYGVDWFALSDAIRNTHYNQTNR